jgi:hypothetical protein
MRTRARPQIKQPLFNRNLEDYRMHHLALNNKDLYKIRKILHPLAQFKEQLYID